MGLFDELQGHHPVREAELLAKEAEDKVKSKKADKTDTAKPSDPPKSS